MRVTTAMVAASMALLTPPRTDAPSEAAEIDTITNLPQLPTNLPGESNRAFAARMKAARK